MFVSRRLCLVVVALAALAFASGCTLIGQGDLNVANDESGLAGPALFRAFEHDEGDLFPPEGWLGIGVIGSQFGDPPSYGMDGFLYVVSTGFACPQTEAGPELYYPDDVVIQGLVTVTDGDVKGMLLIPDTAQNRTQYWALIDINPYPDTGGGHWVYRCGEVEWSG